MPGKVSTPSSKSVNLNGKDDRGTVQVMARNNQYSKDLDKNPANYTPLSPLTFIERAASVYPLQTAIVYGSTRRNWSETYSRCRRLASALGQRGIQTGDTVAVMLPNIPAMYEVHFGVPMTGAVLNALNIRLDADSIALMLKHADAKVLLTDREFSQTVRTALMQLENKPLIIDVDDPEFEGGEFIGELEYEAFLDEGDAEFEWQLPQDEWQAIALGYTSGTTGDPKGVVTHHRGSNGLINEVVDASNLKQATRDLARKIAAKSSHAIKLGKAMFYQQLTMDLSEAYAYAGEKMACNMESEDAREGIDAFIEKRKPDWKGR